jgi:CHAT domain-containing protein/tetratricopeptide (TPR) repeat protein
MNRALCVAVVVAVVAAAGRSRAEEPLVVQLMPAMLSGDDATTQRLLATYEIGALKRDIMLCAQASQERLNDRNEPIGPRTAVYHLVMLRLLDYGIKRFSDAELVLFRDNVAKSLESNPKVRLVLDYGVKNLEFAIPRVKEDGLARQAAANGDYAKATPYFERCASEARAAGAYHWAADCGFMLAGLLGSQVRFADAGRAAKQASEGLDKVLDPTLRRTWQVQLFAVRLSGELASGVPEASLRRDVEAMAAELERNKAAYPVAVQLAYYQSVAQFEDFFGHAAAAAALAERALNDPALAASEAKDAVGYRVSLFMLAGRSWKSLGQLSKALEARQAALTAADKLGMPVAQLLAHQEACIAYLDVADYGEAEKHCQQSMRVAQQMGNALAVGEAAKHLGILYKTMRRLPEAEQALRQASEALATNAAAVAQYSRGYALMYLAEVIGAQGREAEARKGLEEARQLFTRNNYTPGLIQAAMETALLQIKGKEPAAALLSLAVAEKGLLASGLADTNPLVYHLYGLTYRDQGDKPKAIEAFEHAVRITESLRSNVSNADYRQKLFGVSLDVYEDLIRLLLVEGRGAEALDYSERAKSRTLLDELQSRAVPLRGVDPSLLERLRGIEAQAHAVTQAMRPEAMVGSQLGAGEAPAVVDVQAAGKRLGELEAERQSLLASLGTTNREARALLAVEPLAVADIVATLPADLAVVAYHTLEQGTVAYVIADRRLSVTVLDADAAGLTTAVEQFRRDIEAGLVLPALAEPATALGVRGLRSLKRQAMANPKPEGARGLYRSLFPAEVLERIRGKRLLIVPHGPLHKLPFAALINPETQRFLVEDFELSFAPSLQVYALLAARTKEAPGTRLFAVGNPSFAATDLTNLFGMAIDKAALLPLPGAEEEVKLIAKGYGQSTVLTGAPATEGAVQAALSAGNDFGIVHLATHAVFNSAVPMASSIFLNGDAHHDGLLQTPELFSLDLSRAALVVLSACQSGLAKIERGDELLGLQRGLLHAGARAVLLTLWEVSDDGTLMLMKHFYEGLRAKQRPSQALRQAQVDMIKMKGLNLPVYWAAFFVSGLSE